MTGPRATSVGAVERAQARIDEEAGEWLILMHDDAKVASADDLARFESWRTADERHGAAYDALTRTWIEATELRHRMRSLADPAVAPPWWRRAFGVGRGGAMWPALATGGLVAAAAALVAALVIFPLIDRPDAEYATAVAEMRPVILSDGTVVTLGPLTSIDVNFSEGERRVTLSGGEAFFEVAHNANRPFFVDAGTATVRVVGTKFDVRRSDDRVGVSVLEGIVYVAEGRQVSEAAPARVLRAGERVDVVGKRALLAPAPVVLEVTPVGVTRPGDWRTGRLSFDGVPLREVAADLSRYYGPGVRASDDVGELRVTASFKADELTAFVEALDGALPVVVQREESGRYVVRAP